MDTYNTLKYSPVIDGRSFRWSVGKYLGKRRIVVAWFEHEQDARDYVRNLMKILKASKWQIFSQVEMQYSLPALFASMKVGIVQAVIGAIVAEWMSGKQGLGYILTYASSTYDTPMLLAGIIVTIILGIATYQVISVLEDKFLYWHESKN